MDRKDSEEKSNTERVKVKARIEVALKGVSPFVGWSCSFYIYLHSDRG